MRAEIGRVWRSARWVVVALVVVGALGGLFLDLRLDRLPDSSSAQLVLSDGSGQPASSESASTKVEYITNQLPTYAQLATSDAVLGPAAAAAGTTVDALRPEVTVTALDKTTVLDVDVRAATPQAATDDANAVVRSLTDAISRLETTPGKGPQVIVNTVSPPSVSGSRFVPPWGALTAAGAAAGLLIALLGAVIWASGVPQRLGRRLWAWFLHRPPETGLVRPPGAEDPGRPRDDPEAALVKAAGRWISNRRNRD